MSGPLNPCSSRSSYSTRPTGLINQHSAVSGFLYLVARRHVCAVIALMACSRRQIKPSAAASQGTFLPGFSRRGGGAIRTRVLRKRCGNPSTTSDCRPRDRPAAESCRLIPAFTDAPATNTGPAVPWSVPSEPFSSALRPNSLNARTTTRSASFAAARSSRNALTAPENSRSNWRLRRQLDRMRVITGLDDVENTRRRAGLDRTCDQLEPYQPSPFRDSVRRDRDRGPRPPRSHRRSHTRS